MEAATFASTGKWIIEVWYISAITKDKTVKFSSNWMELENTILSKSNGHAGRQELSNLSCLWTLAQNFQVEYINRNIHKSQGHNTPSAGEGEKGLQREGQHDKGSLKRGRGKWGTSLSAGAKENTKGVQKNQKENCYFIQLQNTDFFGTHTLLC